MTCGECAYYKKDGVTYYGTCLKDHVKHDVADISLSDKPVYIKLSRIACELFEPRKG